MEEIVAGFSNMEGVIAIEESGIAAAVRAILPIKRKHEHNYGFNISVQGNRSNGYCLSADNQEVVFCATPEEAILDIFNIIGRYKCRMVYREEMILHAAGVQFGGKAVLFSGISGSGKTTCSLEFSRFGRYMGDEYCHINNASGTARFDGYPLHLKIGNPYLEKFDETDRIHTYDNTTGRKGCYISTQTVKRYTGTLNETYKQEALPIAAIIYPHYSPTSIMPQIGSIDVGNLPEYILSGLIGDGPPAHLLQLFVRMITQHHICLLEMSYSDLPDAAEKLYQILMDKAIDRIVNRKREG